MSHQELFTQPDSLIFKEMIQKFTDMKDNKINRIYTTCRRRCKGTTLSKTNTTNIPNSYRNMAQISITIISLNAIGLSVLTIIHNMKG